MRIGEAHAGIRYEEELKVAVRIRHVIGDVQYFIELTPHRLPAQTVRRHILQSHLRNHTQRAHRYLRRLKQLGVGSGITIHQLAAGIHQLQALDKRRHTTDVGTGSVRCSGQTARQRLLIDIRHIDQCLAGRLQWLADIAQPAARPQCGLQRFGIMIYQTAQAREGYYSAVRRHQR